MTQLGNRPLFSVIIPTRNRAGLFAVALQSVLEQRFRDFEVIVVDDGSAESHLTEYRRLVQAASASVRLLTLTPTGKGHGPSYSTNHGVRQALGYYLCFLDDDDQWTDSEHLQRVARVIRAAPAGPELILANQHAFQNGIRVERVVWIEDLLDRLAGPPDETGAYVVTPRDLLRCRAHCHLNTTIVSREFFIKIGEFDTELRFEQDREFFLRAIDNSHNIRFLPFVVARHNIPDPAAKSSVSTLESGICKRLYQLRIMDKVFLFSRRPEIREYAIRHRGYALQSLADEAKRAGLPDCAQYYARESLFSRITSKIFFLSPHIAPAKKVRQHIRGL